jgi:hypothetical protein
MKLAADFEHRKRPLATPAAFARRVARSIGLVVLLMAVSLAAGMFGYHTLESMSWIDAFHNAAMLMGGMGPVSEMKTGAGKLFAGLYALYCGLFLLIAAGIVLAPLAHRLVHRFHLEEDR